MRVLVLFIRYGTEKYRDALTELDLLYRRRAPEVTRFTTVIDNALPIGFTETIGEGTVLIGGDNTWWEFSGWQHAVGSLGGDITQYDAVHFVTSAFRTHYTGYLERFSARLVEIVAKRPIATGHIDYYPHPVRFGTYVSRHWMRSAFWLINPVELLRLKTLVGLESRRGIFSSQGDWPFAEGGLLSRGYQELIHGWLTSAEGTGQANEWHSRFDLTAETRKLFEDKSLAIINEHLLSVRLRAQGTHVLDMSYLAEVADGAQPMPHAFPSWRRQMQLRGIPGHDQIGDAAFR